MKLPQIFFLQGYLQHVIEEELQSFREIIWIFHSEQETCTNGFI